MFAVADGIHLWVPLPFNMLYPVTTAAVINQNIGAPGSVRCSCDTLHLLQMFAVRHGKEWLAVHRAIPGGGVGFAPSRAARVGEAGATKGRTRKRGIRVQPNLVVRTPVNCTEQRSRRHVRVAR